MEQVPPKGPAASPSAAHDFDSISPSAYALLLMKALTPIPYAREAAALLPSFAPVTAGNFRDASFLMDPYKRSAGFWARVLHFESRYLAVDQLLSDLNATNVLELSSGFSFRGLALTRQRPVYYIDTDLPNLIATKRRFIEALTGGVVAIPAAPAPAPTGEASAASPMRGEPTGKPPSEPSASAASPMRGEPTGKPASEPSASAAPGAHYELQPLNALDTAAFESITQRFPPGELTIVNEGLLVYLDTAEKERVCQNIRDALSKRGGSWITADIYLRSSTPRIFEEEKSDAFLKFVEQHNIEENKFSDFDEARAFFSRMGFRVDRESNVDYSTLSALPSLLAAASPEQLDRLRGMGRTPIHAIWRLRLA